MTAPRWEDVAASIDRAQRHLDCVPMPCVETQLTILELQTAEQLVGDIRDAALARLAEPTAAEQWRAVPERARAATLAQLDLRAEGCFGGDCNGVPYADRVEAERALLALAREAERGGT